MIGFFLFVLSIIGFVGGVQVLPPELVTVGRVGEGTVFSRFSYDDLSIVCVSMAFEGSRGQSVSLFLHKYFFGSLSHSCLLQNFENFH